MKSVKNEQEQTVLQTMQSLIARLPEEECITMGSILELVERDGLLILCIFLTLPFMVPVSIPGVSTIFGLIILLIGLSIMFDFVLRLPGGMMAKRIPVNKLRHALEKGTVWVHRLEKVSRPRIPALTHGSTLNRVNGLMLVIAAALLMAPFGFVPFSNTLPGLAVLFLAIGMLQRDGVCIILGVLTNVMTAIYFAFLILGGTAVLQKLWQLRMP
jgi:hypothetical protein